MSHVSHRLKTAFEGALAGGGDPATSPLYVFGPFLKLLAASGAGAVCFGAPLWLVVVTVVVVSLMYRNVMRWVPDGSGGSGLCEEEFGGWAVKVNSSITAIEYTLTFLVSIAALVTFIADRANGLGRIERTVLAVVLTGAVAVVVNRGPRLAARVFGPATAAVLLLLWVLVAAVIMTRGLHLPQLSSAAFSLENLPVTLGGYVRLLALMTGIEVFANLVAAYEGPAEVRARKAFGSLLIVMVTTLVTMLVVGPAIYDLADPLLQDVSVFTQTMDALLPRPLAYAGTLIGIIVLLSAAAASAQGLQNLTLGLRHRNYVTAAFGQRNRFDVADRPVLLQAAIVIVCFIAFGTNEETYLALYAAGVFVLLGLTGWAAVKRLARGPLRAPAQAASFAGTVIAALVTSAAAGLIFFERLTEGAWVYAVLVPALYFLLTRLRARLGEPPRLEERLGRSLAEQKTFSPVTAVHWPEAVIALVDGEQSSECAAVSAASVAHGFSSQLGICGVADAANAAYLASLSHSFRTQFSPQSATTETLGALAVGWRLDLLVATRELHGLKQIVNTIEAPLLIVSASAPSLTRYARMSRVLVGLDGSSEAEASLLFAARFLGIGAYVSLVVVPEGDTTETTLKAYAEKVLASYLPTVRSRRCDRRRFWAGAHAGRCSR